MNPVFYLILLSVLAISCSSESVKIEKEENILSSSLKRENADTLKKENIIKRKNSLLKEKVQKLYQLKNKYIVKSIDSSDIFKTRLFKQLQNLSSSGKIDKDSFVIILKDIIETRKAFVKGEKSIYSNTYPRANISEYIFKDTTSAKIAYNFIKGINKNKRLWFLVSKEPYSCFLEREKLYYISSGGEYMRGLEKEIEICMKGT